MKTATTMKLNFANQAQRSAGLEVSALEYLKTEGLAWAALMAAADFTGANKTVSASIEADKPDYANAAARAAEFESLVEGAQIAYQDISADPAPIRALVKFYIETGCRNPARELARLAAHLDW